jgi:hypothetical protein
MAARNAGRASGVSGLNGAAAPGPLDRDDPKTILNR